MEVVGVEVPTWAVLTAIILPLLYIHGTWTFSIFSQIGLPGPKPTPYFGNLLGFFRWGRRQFNRDLAKKYGDIVGFYEGRQPVVQISNPELLKQILIKDFNNFVNRRLFDNFDAPLDISLSGLKGDHWKRVRNLLTPVFTTGKLKQMTNQISSCGHSVIQFLNEQAEKQEMFDLGRCAMAFSLDVIASTSFGIDTNAVNNPNDEFVRHIHSIMSPGILVVISLFFLTRIFKSFRKLFGLSMFPKESIDFFRNIIHKLLRQKTQRQHNFLQLMKDAHLETSSDSQDIFVDHSSEKPNAKRDRTSKMALTTEEIMAQSLLFFLAGSATTGNTVTFFCYSTATNQDIQEKLISEIDEIVGDQETITPELIEAMPYLEQCVNETLRMYNPILILDRVADNDVNIKGYKLPKGTCINIAVDVIHHNPEFWPDPERFDPERFSPENKPKIIPMTFLPFGFGPRNCIGMRLALLEVKVVITKIFQNFRLKTCDKTPDPIMYGRGLLRPRDKVWLLAERRTK